MRHASRSHLLAAGALAATVAASSVAASSVAAQAPAPAPAAPTTPAVVHAHPAAGDGVLESLARLTVAIAQVRDSTQRQLSLARHKTPQAQQQLRAQAAAQVTALLREAGLSEADYQRRTYLVSTDTAARRAFDATVARLTGEPAPGQVSALASAATPVLPSGALGAHLGHLLQTFADTPMARGLLPTALDEARLAAQHAALAMRESGDLAATQRHAGHVLHALDPSAGGPGPGLGYGVQRAALAVAAHAELAAKVPNAPPPVVAHAGHVATAARATARRAEAAAALARRIQAATTTADAAALASQLASLTNELLAGRDADANGRIDASDAEGGLQQCEEHARLLAGAAAPK